MKIAQIDASIFTWPYDSALTLALAEAGHQVRIFGRPARKVEEEGRALVFLVPHFYRSVTSPFVNRLPSGAQRVWKGLAHVRGMYSLLGALRKFEPDIIHFQWSPLPVIDVWFTRALSRIAGTVLTVHDSAPFNGSPRAKAQLASSISIFSRFDRLLVHTEDARSRLLGYGLPEGRVRLVPHGPLSRHHVAGAEVPIPSRDDHVEILMFGYLKPYKGIDVLIEAAARLGPEAGQRARILIVGKPFMDVEPLRELITALGLADRVRIEARFVPDAEVAVLFAKADIVALPYREIDASGVLLTAVDAGVPVVGSSLGLAEQLLEDGKHGRLVPPGDPDALATALEELIDADDLRRQMSTAMSELNAAIPSWSEIAISTVRIYEELLRDVAR